MTESRLIDYLDHMMEAATNARSFVDGMEKDRFLLDKRGSPEIVEPVTRAAGPTPSAASHGCRQIRRST